MPTRLMNTSFARRALGALLIAASLLGVLAAQKDDNTPARHAHLIHGSNPAMVWEVPGAGHTGAWNDQPREFERRVPAWFDPNMRR